MQDVETAAREGALQEIMGMVDKARVQRLRSRIPKPPAAAAVQPEAEANPLEELEALVGEQAPPEG